PACQVAGPHVGVGDGVPAVAVAVGVAEAAAVGVAVGVRVEDGVAVAVGLEVGVAVTVGVGVTVGQPPPVTLTSTEVVVLVPVYPPTATALLPISVPTGNERCWFKVGPLVQLLVAGSNICRLLVVSGLNSRLNHAFTPVLPDVGNVPEPR